MVYRFADKEYVAKDGEKERITFEVKEIFEDKLLLEVRMMHKETGQVTSFPKMVIKQIDHERNEEFVQLFNNLRVYSNSVAGKGLEKIQ